MNYIEVSSYLYCNPYDKEKYNYYIKVFDYLKTREKEINIMINECGLRSIPTISSLERVLNLFYITDKNDYNWYHFKLPNQEEQFSFCFDINIEEKKSCSFLKEYDKNIYVFKLDICNFGVNIPVDYINNEFKININKAKKNLKRDVKYGLIAEERIERKRQDKKEIYDFLIKNKKLFKDNSAIKDVLDYLK